VRKADENGTNTHPVRTVRAPVTPVIWKLLPVLAGGVKRVQFLAGLEANCLAGGDADLSAGSWISADAGFPGPNTEHAKTAQFNTLAGGESLFQALKDRIDGGFRFGSRQTGAFYYVMDDVLLDQRGNLARFDESTSSYPCDITGFAALMGTKHFSSRQFLLLGE
jgi:hypothetical protein